MILMIMMKLMLTMMIVMMTMMMLMMITNDTWNVWCCRLCFDGSWWPARHWTHSQALQEGVEVPSPPPGSSHLHHLTACHHPQSGWLAHLFLICNTHILHIWGTHLHFFYHSLSADHLRLFVGLLVGCLTSQQHASVSQGRICSIYMLPHWHRSCRSNFLSHPVTVYWQWADQSQCWPKNARHLAG